MSVESLDLKIRRNQDLYVCMYSFILLNYICLLCIIGICVHSHNTYFELGICILCLCASSETNTVHLKSVNIEDSILGGSNSRKF